MLEGGIGGNYNTTAKQIRPRFAYPGEPAFNRDLDIAFEVINSYDKKDMWTYEELDDLIQAFSKTLSLLLGEENIVSGHITQRG